MRKEVAGAGLYSILYTTLLNNLPIPQYGVQNPIVELFMGILELESHPRRRGAESKGNRISIGSDVVSTLSVILTRLDGNKVASKSLLGSSTTVPRMLGSDHSES